MIAEFICWIVFFGIIVYGLNTWGSIQDKAKEIYAKQDYEDRHCPVCKKFTGRYKEKCKPCIEKALVLFEGEK